MLMTLGAAIWDHQYRTRPKDYRGSWASPTSPYLPYSLDRSPPPCSMQPESGPQNFPIYAYHGHQQMGITYTNPSPESSITLATNADNQRVAPHWESNRMGPQTDGPSTPSSGDTHSGGHAFFSNAHNFNLDHFEYNVYNHSSKSKGWDKLVAATAPNALFDAKARFDPPKCDEDTRVEVTKEIMDWIQDREVPQSLLYMTGAAGSGKSALQQTISEQCAESEILAASFFFGAGDDTRNNTARLIPTIAYQLGQKNSTIRRLIGEAVDNDPLIFGRTLLKQMQALVLTPLSRLPSSASLKLPYAVLIDGLDECSDENGQIEVLRVIAHCLTKERTPLRFFIASRPEMVILQALKHGGHLHEAAYHIQLSDDYDATADIRRTVKRRLRELQERRCLPVVWFTNEDIEIIVDAASGQYIYAITAVRYVSEPRSSPVERLHAVLNWAAGNGDSSSARPFASLDKLYTNILVKAKEAYYAVDSTNQCDFLLVLNAYLQTDLLSPSDVDQPCELEENTFETITCDLRALVKNPDENDWDTRSLGVYHKSFKDFLESQDRAGPLYTLPRALEYIVSSILRWAGNLPAMRPRHPLRCGHYFDEDDVSIFYQLSSVCMTLSREHWKTSSDALINPIIECSSKDNGRGWSTIDSWLMEYLQLEPKRAEPDDTVNWLIETFERVLPLIMEKNPEAAAIVQDYYERWKLLQTPRSCSKCSGLL
ncbi:hypothetical protein DFP72DRAFT_889602 [Ephemerocybe angulata]|uniref:Nephrocystin 3-like N-terminal domain-containing protein n=1 Tax=Ephemerocybe angulata TaxID=980116 RepID=A0A8H6I603_9AGAR|nr:hypothetical protein DFP72DRAFT_889602 [Tulosesus angulatus]